MEISEITNGAFDITAGPMVNAWGFGPEEKLKMTQEKVDSLIALTGYQKIKVLDRRNYKGKSEYETRHECHCQRIYQRFNS